MPGEAVSFDPGYKSALLTEFYTNLFKATETQEVLPSWVRLDDKFKDSDFQGMPRIDGSLIRRAISLFKNNNSCAGDNVVSEMLRVLDEDVLDLIADAFKIRILNRENEDAEENTTGVTNSRFVQFPYDDNIDRRDGLGTKRHRNTVHIEDSLAMSCVADPILSHRRALGLSWQRWWAWGPPASHRALVT